MEDAVALLPPGPKSRAQPPASPQSQVPGADGIDDLFGDPDPVQVKEDAGEGDAIEGLGEVKGADEGKAPAKPGRVETALRG